MDLYFAIIERSCNFCVLETGFGKLDYAWEKANKIQGEYKNLDIDVLVFNTKKERIEYILESTRE